MGVTIQPTDDHPLSVFLETDITPEGIGRWVVFVDWLTKSYPNYSSHWYQIVINTHCDTIPSLASVVRFTFKRWLIDWMCTTE